MTTYIVRRVLQMIPVLFGVTLAVFLMMHMLPGDAAVFIAGEAASPETIEQIRQNLGLNDPLPVQYFRYLGNILQGDLGQSIQTNRAVVDEIFEVRFQTTVQLAIFATSTGVILGLIIGIISAARKYTFIDIGLMLISLFGLSLPTFWLGILLINFFSVQNEWLPIIGWGTPQQMIMPVLTLSIGGSANIARMTRASLIEVLGQDYIRTAYAKGMGERVVIFRHAMRNALIPVITIAGLQFGFLLTGAMISETIFAINGMGRLILSAVQSRDIPLAQGAILISATLFVLVNCAVDVIYRLVNRRIELN